METNELALCFGCWRYYPSSGVIKKISPANYDNGNDDEQRHLSRDTHLVLNFFLNNPEKLVTKEELVKLLKLSKNNPNLHLLRVVSSLRKILGDDSKNPIYIQTQKKRGFRFIAKIYPECKKSIENNTTKLFLEGGILVFNKIHCSKNIIINAIFSVLFFIIIIFMVSQYHHDDIDMEHRVISELKGVELQPSVSPDEKYIVYSHSENRVNKFTMILQNLITGEKAVIKSDPNAVLHGFTWSADQKSIYYQRLWSNKLCEIRKISLSESIVESDTVVSKCGVFSFAANVQISPDQKFLFYPSRNSNESGSVIVKYSLENGTTEQITAPPTYGFGDYSISLSADGTKIAFLRDYQFTNAELWVLSLESKNLEMIYRSTDFYPLMISWANDQDNILIPTDDNRVFSVSHSSKQLKNIAFTEKPIKEISQMKSGDYVVSHGHFWDSHSWIFNNPLTNKEQLKQKLPYSRNSESIVIINHIPEAPSAVFSTKNGIRSLIFVFPDGKEVAVRTPKINDRFANGVFSANGNRFLFRVGSQLWVNDVRGSSKLLPLSVNTSSKFSWSADGNSIFFTSSLLGQQQVFVHNLNTSDTSILNYNLKFYAESPDGSYSIQLRYNQPYVEIRYSDSGKVQPIKSTIDPNILISRVVLRSNAVYFYVPILDKKFDVARFNLKSGAFETVGIQQSFKGRAFNVSYDERFIYLDDGKKGNVDIAVITGG